MNRTDIVACIHKHLGQPDDLENLIALADEIARIAAEAEREECARVCIDQGAYRDEIEMAMECAWAIRQRSNASVSGAEPKAECPNRRES